MTSGQNCVNATSTSKLSTNLAHLHNRIRYILTNEDIQLGPNIGKYKSLGSQHKYCTAGRDSTRGTSSANG